MLFQKQFVEQILSGEKTRTTRFRKRAMVKVGSIYKAKTHRFSKEHFALIKVVKIRTADFSPHSEFRSNSWIADLSAVIGYQNRERHAEKEGVEDWYEFRDVYTKLNAEHRDDSERKHYVIDFGVVNADGEFIKTKFAIGDWVTWDRDDKQKTAQVLEIKYSEGNQDWCYRLNSFINNVKDFWDWEMEKNLKHSVNTYSD